METEPVGTRLPGWDLYWFGGAQMVETNDICTRQPQEQARAPPLLIQAHLLFQDGGGPTIYVRDQQCRNERFASFASTGMAKVQHGSTVQPQTMNRSEECAMLRFQGVPTDLPQG